MAIKHIGRLVRTQGKVAVAYRVLPGDPDNCLIVKTESLDADQHDTMMRLIESNSGQTAYELGEAMMRSQLPDGRNMLAAFHKFGKFIKVPTTEVEMTPDTKTKINLAELNKMIAEQRGVTVEDLAIKEDGSSAESSNTTNEPVVQEETTATVTNTDGILSDEDLAAQYRSQADALFKEAKKLREQAEELAPTKRKTKNSGTKVEETT
jgi:hypothetical protein